MSVCIVDFSCLTHEVLQILPGGGGGEVLHHNAISSPCTRWPPSTESTPVAISTSEVTTSTTTSTSTTASCVLHANSSSIKVFSIEILNIVMLRLQGVLWFHEETINRLLTKIKPLYHLDNILSIAAVLKLSESKALLIANL